MIKLFLKENSAWLLFFVLLMLVTNIVYHLDAGVSAVSIAYLNTVQLVLIVLFLVLRFGSQYRLIQSLLQGVPLKELHEQKLSAIQLLYWQQCKQELQRQEMAMQMQRVQVLEEKDDILAWIHEMKAPLTALKLMHGQVEDAKLQRKLETDWLRLYLLLDQRLHKARLMTMEQDNRLEKVNLRQVVYQEIRDFQSWCIEKGIGFEADILDQEVVTDRKWIGFIVRQVLSNAIKYSKPNTTIIVDICDEQGHVNLCIRDEGCGIRPEDLPRIFKKSYTGTVGRESTASTGMGLYLAKRAADQLGITLRVESILGEGTCVKVQFPVENEYIKSFGM